jgi:hypothetical protein
VTTGGRPVKTLSVIDEHREYLGDTSRTRWCGTSLVRPPADVRYVLAYQPASTRSRPLAQADVGLIPAGLDPLRSGLRRKINTFAAQ